jgi:hypothetical protein
MSARAIDQQSLTALRLARKSIDKAITSARLGKGIKFDVYTARAALGGLLDD